MVELLALRGGCKCAWPSSHPPCNACTSPVTDEEEIALGNLESVELTSEDIEAGNQPLPEPIGKVLLEPTSAVETSLLNWWHSEIHNGSMNRPEITVQQTSYRIFQDRAAEDVWANVWAITKITGTEVVDLSYYRVTEISPKLDNPESRLVEVRMIDHNARVVYGLLEIEHSINEDSLMELLQDSLRNSREIALTEQLKARFKVLEVKYEMRLRKYRG